MAFVKTQSVEKTEVLSPEEHRTLQEKLHRIGKLNAQKLTDQERQEVLNTDS